MIGRDFQLKDTHRTRRYLEIELEGSGQNQAAQAPIEKKLIRFIHEKAKAFAVQIAEKGVFFARPIDFVQGQIKTGQGQQRGSISLKFVGPLAAALNQGIADELGGILRLDQAGPSLASASGEGRALNQCLELAAGHLHQDSLVNSFQLRRQAGQWNGNSLQRHRVVQGRSLPMGHWLGETRPGPRYPMLLLALSKPCSISNQAIRHFYCHYCQAREHRW